jgi:hypothetical protein
MKSFNMFVEELKKVGGQLGSNPGGVHVDTKTGEKHYVKFYKNPDQAKTETLTSRIHEHMGIHTLHPEHKVIDGKHAVVTKWNEHLSKMEPHEFEHLNHDQQKDIGKMYHAAVLTKNWDIVGLDHDNIEKDKHTGKLHSVDAGGAFHFRAQGGPKHYGPDVDEKHTLLNRPGEASSHVFSTVFKQNPEAKKHGLEAVRKMDMSHVHKLFKNSGLSNHHELYSNFVERRNKLLKGD